MAEVSGLTIGIDASRSAVARQTGTERYSRRIIEALLDAGTRHRFRLYLNRREPLDLPLRAGDLQRTIPFPRLWTHARLSAELLAHPVDALFVPAHVVPPMHPRATVVTVHDLGYLHEPEAHSEPARRYLDLSTRWSTFAARRVVAVSHATRNDLIRHYGVAPEKIDVIYHGVDEQFRPVASDEITGVRQLLDLPERFALHVGTLQPRKNVARLIAAFDAVADHDRDLTLLLVGKRGWKVDSIDAALAASRHRDRIRLAGHLPDAHLPAVYSAAAVLALPSLYEGFGLPVLEAMACGTPVVVSDRGALPEVAGAAAIVVDPLDVAAIADGLAQALAPQSRERRVASGMRHAGGFRWSTAGQQTLATIERAYCESHR